MVKEDVGLVEGGAFTCTKKTSQTFPEEYLLLKNVF